MIRTLRFSRLVVWKGLCNSDIQMRPFCLLACLPHILLSLVTFCCQVSGHWWHLAASAKSFRCCQEGLEGISKSWACGDRLTPSLLLSMLLTCPAMHNYAKYGSTYCSFYRNDCAEVQMWQPNSHSGNNVTTHLLSSHLVLLTDSWIKTTHFCM